MLLPVLIGFGVVELTLLGLLIYTSYFYTTQIKALVDRLMARSIDEFERAKNPPPPRVHVVKPNPPMEDFDRIIG